MMVIPSIDLLDGEVVRLLKGKREHKTVYRHNPADLVDLYVKAGATRLHIVDLNGAFSEPRQQGLTTELVERCKIPVQVGGGIRKEKALTAVFRAGASFAVLGTAALRDPAFVQKACQEHPGKIIVAVDSVNGRVAISGWKKTTDIPAEEVGLMAAEWGAAALLYTDVDRDGTEGGPAVEATAALGQACGIPVIASGGIGHLGHIRALARAGIPMTVVGRALLEGRFSLEQAMEAAS